MRLQKYFFLLAVIVFISASSCTRYRNLVYLQDSQTAVDTFNAVPPSYQIQKRDVLYIRVLSLNEEITRVVNSSEVGSTGQFTNEASLFINGYNVSDSGYVEVPIIGKVYVLGKTLEEARLEMGKQAAVFLKDATITLKLISFKYSVIGEVNKPGVYQNFNNQLTVLEAISSAGDISDYGNRKRIMVIRPGTDGTKTFRLNLTQKEILNSEGFFLLPNDIVYVEPVRSYNLRVNLPVIGTFLTAVSTFILVLNYVQKN